MQMAINRRIFVFGFGSSIVFPAIAAGQGLTGHYQVKGRNPDGSKYSGLAWIEDVLGNISITWEIAGRRFEGKGVVAGNTMTVDWGDSSPVIYEIQNGGRRLSGTWANGQALDILTLSP